MQVRREEKQMNRRAFFIGIGIVFFLCSCSLAPQYVKPQAPIPEEWPQGAAYADIPSSSEASEVRDLLWRDFFADSQLQKIIEMALENNRDLRLAALNVERARALYGIQRAELLPSVAASGVYSKQRRSSDLITPGYPRTVEQYSVNLGIAAWEIDFFGRIRSLKDQALQTYLATDQARRGAQIAIIAEVARTYLTLAADRENLTLALATLEAQQASYNLIQRQYEIGFATQLDLRQAQTRVEAARRDIPRFTQMTAQDINALNLLAGTLVPKSLLPANLEGIHPPMEISAGLPSEVLLNRPDIMTAEYRLKGAYAFIGAARAAFFPRIALTTSIGTASDQLSGLFRAGADTWAFTPQIAMPIFDARTWAALRVSKADREIILTQYEKTIQTAFREVSDALAVQGTINQQIEAQQSLVDAVEDAYHLSTKRYTMGIDSYLNVLDAQRALYAQQQVLISLRLARLSNRVGLYAVLGGGAG
jgi:multidrug efflux system outer membrane protein